MWDLEPLVEGKGAAGVDELIDRAETLVPSMLERRGRIAEIDAGTLVHLMQTMADLQELVGRAASYAGLRFAVDTSDPANGALMQRVQERATAITTQLIWFELEWAALERRGCRRACSPTNGWRPTGTTSSRRADTGLTCSPSRKRRSTPRRT